MSIRPLSKDAVDKIKSSSLITSLNEVVCGLLTNSLDASSTKITIHLDYVLGNCTLQDNGVGIEPREFEPDGGLGKLHHTSKAQSDRNTHGRHGNFIASVATFSLLTITSHHQSHNDQATLSLHNGRVLARHVPAPPDQRFEAFRSGTRVCVCNLFGSMPVRVKQRGLLFSDRSRIDREWESLMRDIAALLLAWPFEVSVSVREANTQREQRLKTGDADVVPRTSRIFIQAGLADSEDANSWVPVSASCRRLRIKGAVSTSPVATRRSQIMSLGIRPIPNSFGTNILYEEVNKLFKSSYFGVVEDDDKIRGIQGKPKKGIERWPMFFLEIRLLQSGDSMTMDDVLGDSQHSLQAILDLLKVACYGFLKKQLLQPKSLQQTPRNAVSPHIGQPQPERQLPSRPVTAAGLDTYTGPAYSPFDAWGRVKVGRAPQSLKVERQSAEGDATNVERTGRRLVRKNGMLVRRPFDDVDQIRGAVRIQATTRSEATSLAESDSPKATEGEVDICPPQTTTALMPQVRQGPDSRSRLQPEDWLKDVIKTWKNPVFEPTEPRIPALRQDASTEPPPYRKHDGPSSRFYFQDNDAQFEASAIALNARLSRPALLRAEIIGQVDRKFLLLRLPLQSTTSAQHTESSSGLIMLDQHAADERCRLEELMSQYFEGDSLQAVTEMLERPITFEVSARENELATRFQTHLRIWGIGYRTSSNKYNRYELDIQSLPPSVLERCRAEPKLAIDIVRKEIWRLEDTNVPPRPVHEPGKWWVSSFHNCPQGIMGLLQSRSCRSAIMFNDELSHNECKQLVERLSRCAFPFQCAHGRPSLVPLVDIALGGKVGDWRAPNVSADRWKAWLEKE